MSVFIKKGISTLAVLRTAFVDWLILVKDYYSDGWNRWPARLDVIINIGNPKIMRQAI